MIVYFTEFCNDFNLYNTNNTNNSITLYNLSLVLVDSSIDTNEFTYPVAIRYKLKDNMINEMFFIKTLNKMIDANNNSLFYSWSLGKFISIVLCLYGFIADQLGKRNYANHTGGNSDYSGMWGYSFNIKELYKKNASCKECAYLLSIGEDADRYSNCLN